MALRQPSNPKQTTDRHETDYERWLKDHDDYYEPAGKPRYHPSDTDNTNDDDNDVDHTRMNTKSKSQALPSQSENIHVDDDGSVIQVSRYGSVMFPSKHSSGLGHQSSPSTDTPLLGIGQNESMMCCGFSIVFVVVVLLGVAWGFKVHRQQRGQEKDKASRDWVEDEKKNLLGEV